MENVPQGPLTVCVYHALPFEADLSTLYPLLWDRGDTLSFARFTRNTLTFGIVNGLEELHRGQLGIPEPLPSASSPALETIDLVLVPGIAFDHAGARLGRGNGGYDKWLEKLRAVNTHALVWGVALDCQMLRELPTEAHDLPMDAIATPRSLLVAKKA